MTEPFDRQERIPGWRQAELARATVIVIGVGAIGNEVARLLAMSGVGRLVLCDPDRVEVTNLSRCVLFRRDDAEAGRFKVDAAASALASLAPATEVAVRPQPLINGVGLSELRDADLVISGTDSRAARLQLAGRCGLVAASWLDGGTSPWGGEIRPFLRPDGPCYGCGLGTYERSVLDAPWSCADVESAPEGSSATLSAIVGAWMGTLAVRFLMGLGCFPQVLRIDGATGASVLVEHRRSDSCPLHRRAGTPLHLGVHSGRTVSDLLTALPSPGTVLSWGPIQTGITCRGCGLRRSEWGIPQAGTCPGCGASIRPMTTYELNQAPRDLSLAELGIAPGEILAVRTEHGYDWVELAPSRSRDEVTEGIT